jgi:hypothetical protein
LYQFTTNQPIIPIQRMKTMKLFQILSSHKSLIPHPLPKLGNIAQLRHFPTFSPLSSPNHPQIPSNTQSNTHTPLTNQQTKTPLIHREITPTWPRPFSTTGWSTNALNLQKLQKFEALRARYIWHTLNFQISHWIQ